jgi:hypothetical protein
MSLAQLVFPEKTTEDSLLYSTKLLMLIVTS